MSSNLYKNAVTRRNIHEGECIKIETKTSAKKINIEWAINKETIDIANASPKGEKKGVIATSIHYGIHTFNLELCVPGWRRSQDGFSAFYLTVPRKKDNDDDFVARYTVAFGRNEHMVTRMSSIRNDFDLGVGFPNFTETEALVYAVYNKELVFRINVEIFECESVIKASWIDERNPHSESIAAGLLSKMYEDRVNADASIVASYLNKDNIKKPKHLRVHKCVLTASSPVFHAFFKEKTISFIAMNQWNASVIMTMIRFLYLGKIELNDTAEIEDEQEDEEHDSLDSLEFDDLTGLQCKYDDQEEVKCSDEEIVLSKNKDANIEMNKLLNYIECGEDVRKLFELFQIGDRYEMNELLIACCHTLRCYVTLETCCVFLAYLEKYTHLNEVKDIKLSILEFIIQNIKTIKSSSGYLYLLQNKPLLMDQMIDKLAV
eukprot:115276_1